MTQVDLLLEGAFVAGARVEPVKNPYDGSVVADVAFADRAQLDRALAFAHRERHALAATPLHRRADGLTRVAELLKRDSEAVARTICLESGKPLALARAEAQRGVDTFQCAAAEARRMDGEALPLDTLPRGEGRFGIVKRFPVGVVAAVSPFNFPLNLVAHKLAPALAAGCPVVLKPASQTPLTALLLARLYAEAGVHPGALQVLPCSRQDADLLVTDDRVKLLSFTGSPQVGWDMKARAGRKKVVLELGGNAGALLMPDADVAAAIPLLRAGAYAYAGQICISVQRILVPASRQAELEASLTDDVRRHVKSGNPLEDGVLNGPMIDAANAQRMGTWLAEAREAGARVLLGGERDGNVVAPILLADTPVNTRLYAEEAFGPVVNVEGYSDVDDAIARLNRGRFGLQAGVFTRDISTLWKCFENLEVGGVIHNDVPTFRSDQMPYGGIKDSGLGREGIRYALEDMTERKLLVLRP